MGWINKMKRGALGTGTLMLFIAVLILVAIVAGVLLTNVFEINTKTLVTGMEIRQEVGSMVSVTAIRGVNGTDGTIENLTMFIQHADDTLPINLRDTLLYIELDNTSRNYRYNQTYNYSHMENSTEYAVRYIRGPYSDYGFLDRDDIVEIFLWPPRLLMPDNHMTIRFIPKLGQPTVLSFRVPDPIVTESAILYPTKWP